MLSIWHVLLEECCKRKLLNGIEYHLKETNDGLASENGCLDSCIYEDSENMTVCFKPGTYPAECLAPTSYPSERGYTNMTVKEDTNGYFCDLQFDYSINKTFKIESDPMTKCIPWNSLTDALNFLDEKKFKIKSSEGIDLDCQINPIFTSSNSESIKFAAKAVRKTLNCTVSTEACLTNNGSVYPAKCSPTFRYKGQEYHACTDQGLSEEDGRLWCATSVDSQLNLVDGQWGYCSSKCSYCGGSPVVNNTQARGFYRPCGYDCLVNPGKQLTGSLGSKNVPLLPPTATLYGDYKENFIRDVRGQIQLYTGEQLVRLTCPNSKFFDMDLKGFKTIYALCGPKQYRFTVYAENGDLLHTEFKNDRFGCDPCPPSYIYIPGYVSNRDERHLSTSYGIPNVDLCEDMCYNTKTCRSFSYSQKGQICDLFVDIIVEATYGSYEDFALCSSDPECCEKIEISATGDTSLFQLNRLGTFSRFGSFNNRAAYKQVSGSKILFYAGYQDRYGWVVSSGFNSLGGLRSPPSKDTLCPTDSLSWEYYSGSVWIEDPSVVLSCKSEETETKLRGLSDEQKDQNEDSAKLLEKNWGQHIIWRSTLQAMAYKILLESVRLEPQFTESFSTNDQFKGLLFHKSTLEVYKLDQEKEKIIWLPCDKYVLSDSVKQGEVFNIPSQGRLRHIVHEIGHLMIVYGKINRMDDGKMDDSKIKTKLIKVDNFLYEIGLIKETQATKANPPKRGLLSLFIAPIACYYSTENQVPNGKLKSTQCTAIQTNYKEVKDLSYPTISAFLPREPKDENPIVYAALQKLFMKESSSSSSSQTGINNFYQSNYVNDLKAFQAFMAEILTIALVAETVRNVETLPVLLTLIDLYEKKPEAELFRGSILNIHPMAGRKTFYSNSLAYEVDGDIRMEGVGFFPIYQSITVYEQFWKYKDTREDNLAGMWRVHEKATTIMEAAGQQDLLPMFFNTGTGEGLTIQDTPVPKQPLVEKVFKAQDKKNHRPPGQ